MFFAFLASPIGVDEIEGITVDEIETRAQLHNSCDPTSVCEDYYVGGFYSMAFIALAMYCQRTRKCFFNEHNEAHVQVNFSNT